MGVTNINGTNASGKTISGATPLAGSFHNPPYTVPSAGASQ